MNVFSVAGYFDLRVFVLQSFRLCSALKFDIAVDQFVYSMHMLLCRTWWYVSLLLLLSNNIHESCDLLAV